VYLISLRLSGLDSCLVTNGLRAPSFRVSQKCDSPANGSSAVRNDTAADPGKRASKLVSSGAMIELHLPWIQFGWSDQKAEERIDKI
jgi:hypothetical protein